MIQYLTYLSPYQLSPAPQTPLLCQHTLQFLQKKKNALTKTIHHETLEMTKRSHSEGKLCCM